MDFDAGFGLIYLILDLTEQQRKKEQRIRRNKMRASKWDSFRMSEADFIKSYRLSKEQVYDLIRDLSPLIKKESRRDALTIKEKVLIALAFFASGSYQTLVGQSIYNAVSQPTVSRAVRQVTRALNSQRIFQKYVSFPITRQERDKIKQRFYNKYRMPGVVGCIDGTHVAIVKPCEHEERYFNRKGYHSLNVMIICDIDLNILSVDPSYPGSTHDSRVWADHPLNRYIMENYENGEIMYLLGDSGYPLRKTLMTPFLNAAEGTPEAHYYEVQVSARNVVERCIGVLKARFRCLLNARKLHYSPIVAGQIVNACAVLHNIANSAKIAIPQLNPEEENQERQLQINYRVSEELLQNKAEIHMGQGHPRQNIPLAQGRAVQQALIQRLWQERRQ